MLSYLKNEQLRGELMDKYEEQEKTAALQIRREALNPDVILTQWLTLLSHKGPGKIIMDFRM